VETLGEVLDSVGPETGHREIAKDKRLSTKPVLCLQRSTDKQKRRWKRPGKEEKKTRNDEPTHKAKRSGHLDLGRNIEESETKGGWCLSTLIS